MHLDDSEKVGTGAAPRSTTTTGTATTDYTKDVEVGPFVKPEYMSDVRRAAPEEVVKGVEREERSAKGMVESAKDFVK